MNRELFYFSHLITKLELCGDWKRDTLQLRYNTQYVAFTIKILIMYISLNNICDLIYAKCQGESSGNSDVKDQQNVLQMD